MTSFVFGAPGLLHVELPCGQTLSAFDIHHRYQTCIVHNSFQHAHVQVAFDPLDGSSIVGANFAVGSIFGIWPGDELIGRQGSEQAAAAYAVYGPRTILVIAWPHQQGEGVILCSSACAFIPRGGMNIMC